MAYFKLKGTATINGSCKKPFEVVVESNDSNFTTFSDRKVEAVKKLYPSWEAICVDFWEKIS